MVLSSRGRAFGHRTYYLSVVDVGSNPTEITTYLFTGDRYEFDSRA
jgi:hypothetical protein